MTSYGALGAFRDRPYQGGASLPTQVTLAVLAAVAGLMYGGCLYINHVAAGITRIPVMFAVIPSPTPAAPR